ncbi:hypothetical protein ACVBEH_16065 [Roseateles sp. GG27B]
MTDPTNAANKVAKVVKSATAEVWAGTTVSTLANQAIAAINFNSSKVVTMRVWSPDTGVRRAEGGERCRWHEWVETEAMTTVAGAWQTLSFNFAALAAGSGAGCGVPRTKPRCSSTSQIGCPTARPRPL